MNEEIEIPFLVTISGIENQYFKTNPVASIKYDDSSLLDNFYKISNLRITLRIVTIQEH